MHKNILYSFLLCLSCINVCIANSYRAFCKSPVADIISAPASSDNATHEQVKRVYESIPASWGPSKIDQLACPRIHQLLLHEIVSVIEENEFEAHVEISSLIAVGDAQTVKSVHGWVLKDCLCKLDEECLPYLPEPIDWQTGSISDNDQIVALISPYIDKDNKLYSAGTRFVLTREAGQDFHAVAFDDQLNNFKEISIPQSLCAYQPTLAEYDKRMLFCTLIGLWSEIPDLVIPLVWGGASIGGAYTDADYTLAQREINGKTLQVWERPTYGFATQMGIDASNLVSRAAQLVGIPYFCKNSLTASLLLDELAVDEQPLEGDLIWLPGGLLILNDLEQNAVVTCMSYSSGYGALVTLPLSAVFKDIETVDDVIAAKNSGASLTTLNRDGSVARVVNEFKILKLL